MNWLNRLKVQTRFKEPLNRHTTLRIGGPADIWAEPRDFRELQEIISRCNQRQIPYFVIGKGSNILFSDRGFRGLVLYLGAPAFSTINIKGNRIFSGAGVSLNKLLNQAQKSGLAGLEFLSGIPASTAGALVMNAGSCKRNIGSLVNSVTVMDKKGKVKVLNGKQLKFGYRRSNLNRYIVLQAEFQLVKSSPRVVREKMSKFLAQKRKSQDLAAKSAGCIFKNPRHYLTAGEMIEACGLKRRRKGDAEISARHANYFVNRRSAKAKDILYLIDLAQRQVKEKFAVDLEPEIKIVK